MWTLARLETGPLFAWNGGAFEGLLCRNRSLAVLDCSVTGAVALG